MLSYFSTYLLLESACSLLPEAHGVARVSKRIAAVAQMVEHTFCSSGGRMARNNKMLSFTKNIKQYLG